MAETFTEDTKVLIYLIKVLGSTGRNLLKTAMMDRAATEPEAGKLLQMINKVERILGQMDRQEPEQ